MLRRAEARLRRDNDFARLVLTLVGICVGNVASAASARVRWRGVAVEGRTPPSLQSAVRHMWRWRCDRSARRS